MRTFAKTLALASLAAAALAPDALAVRAIKTPVAYRQPDGSLITLLKSGDERSHLLMTTDRCPVIQGDDGFYRFATLNSQGRLEATTLPAADAAKRTPAQKAVALPLSASQETALLSARPNRRRTVAQDGMGRFTSTFPRKGDINAVVILVEYKDVAFNLQDPHEYFHGLLNTPGFSDYNATGCAAEYFRFNSHDQFRPVFDVLGPVRLRNNRSYYGGNDTWGNDKNAEQMVVEAVKELDPEVDFSRYDMDGDGVVDNIYVIYAGQGEASYGPPSSVWPHSWTMDEAGISLSADGVKINTYGCSNEWESSRPDGVGTFIHEFSHVMGLPDLYPTAGSDADYTPGEWSVLDYGPYNNDGCTPPNYSAYERLAMGWIDPLVVDGPMTVELPDLSASNCAGIIQTPAETEYYLLENRQQSGWDAYLPGHGMLIWHIDFDQKVFDANAVNNDRAHQYVELKKANNKATSDLAGWAWPGTSGAMDFTDSTKPSMKTWNGTALNLPLTEIAENRGVVSFNVAGGAPRILPPVANPPLLVGADWFDASWEAAEGATDYLLTVLYRTPGGEKQTESCDMGSGKTFSLPQGWTSSATDLYTTTGNYGEASPSYKMARNGCTLTSPVMDSDVKQVSMWMKGQNTDDSSCLNITGVKEDGSEVELGSLYPEKNQEASFTLTVHVEGIRQIVFSYFKSVGNLALDDVVIEAGGSTSGILTGYDRLPTNGQTTMRVELPAMEPGTQWSYYVEASDGQYISRPSETIQVELTASAIESISDNHLKVEGRHISSASPFEVYDTAGRRISASTHQATLPSAGLYIVRTPNGATRKLAVR